tara:strand:- start:3278 stop:4459 length:1182 start_codon:yes stop_codon:yes gene_type:complete
VRTRYLLATLTLCAGAVACTRDAGPDVWARLPEPVTNNAVAGIELDGRLMAYSFAGLHAGKTWRDVTADAYACDLEARACREIAGLPDGIGRLASVAVTVRGQIYIFGGYTVAEDGSEASTPEVWRFDPASEAYTHITDMPVPVDDTIALPFEDRYIYLVSGWHDTDNVDLVQVYDVADDRWFEATPFPGAPVFGHAGAMGATGQILVCGGTAVIPPEMEGGRRSFEATDACWAGQVMENHRVIAWNGSAAVPSGPFYRGAAISHSDGAIFVGGTRNAYNYDGIGYDGEPSTPRGDLLVWTRAVDTTPILACAEGDVYSSAGARPRAWRVETTINDQPVMDIRGLVQGRQASEVFVLGGLDSRQAVSDLIVRIPDWTHVRSFINPTPVCVHPR